MFFFASQRQKGLYTYTNQVFLNVLYNDCEETSKNLLLLIKTLFFRLWLEYYLFWPFWNSPICSINGVIITLGFHKRNL